MQPGRLGVLSAVLRRATAPHSGAALGTGVAPLVTAQRRILLELLWQGHDGRFRHLAVSAHGVRRVLGASALVALLAVVALAAVSVGSSRGLASFEVDLILAENRELKARQVELRKRAFDLAEQLRWRIEQARATLGTADSHDEAWAGAVPDPPARDAGNDTVMTWLETQARRLAACEDEQRARQVGRNRERASVEAPPVKTAKTEKTVRTAKRHNPLPPEAEITSE